MELIAQRGLPVAPAPQHQALMMGRQADCCADALTDGLRGRLTSRHCTPRRRNGRADVEQGE